MSSIEERGGEVPDDLARSAFACLSTLFPNIDDIDFELVRELEINTLILLGYIRQKGSRFIPQTPLTSKESDQ